MRPIFSYQIAKISRPFDPDKDQISSSRVGIGFKPIFTYVFFKNLLWIDLIAVSVTMKRQKSKQRKFLLDLSTYLKFMVIFTCLGGFFV